MVCIAAFIILLIIGIFVAFLSIFKRDIGKKYWKIFKKAWGCVGKKVRLQKCETGFKEDVKNTVLSKVIIKHPKWVKPLGVVMEVISVIIVVITVWSLATALKSLLALWALGTCNVTKPSACTFASEQCDLGGEEEPKNIFEATGRWFTEWGDIFAAFPDKFRNWNPEQFDLITINSISSNDKPLAIDILDPGCSACVNSYKNQKNSGFFDKYNVKIVVFPIMPTENEPKFKNSENIARYLYSAAKIDEASSTKLLDIVLDSMFNKKAPNSDGIEVIYQNLFNNEYGKEKAIKVLDEWAKEAGFNDEHIKSIHDKMSTEEITEILKKNQDIVMNDIRANGIPIMLYDGGRHIGRYEQ